MMVQSRVLVLPGSSGCNPMPRKIAGRLMRMMEALTTAAKTPTVVLLKTIHLWFGEGAVSLMGRSMDRGADFDCGPSDMPPPKPCFGTVRRREPIRLAEYIVSI